MRHGSVAVLVSVVVAVSGAGRATEPDAVKPASATKVVAGHDDATKLAQEAMEQLKKNGVSGFLDSAFSERKTSLKQADRAQGESLFGKLHEAAVQRYGKPTGEIELVRTDAVGSSLVRLVYVEKFAKGALVWPLTFYKGDGGEWRWSGFNMGDGVAAEFRPTKATVDRDVRALAQEAVDGLKEKGVEKLLDAILADGKTLLNGSNRLAAEASFVTARSTINTREGKSLGEVELVRTEALGDSFVRLVYLEKCERGGAIWKFTFYRTPDGWKWQNLDVGEFGAEFNAPK